MPVEVATSSTPQGHLTLRSFLLDTVPRPRWSHLDLSPPDAASFQGSPPPSLGFLAPTDSWGPLVPGLLFSHGLFLKVSASFEKQTFMTTPQLSASCGPHQD